MCVLLMPINIDRSTYRVEEIYDRMEADLRGMFKKEMYYNPIKEQFNETTLPENEP